MATADPDFTRKWTPSQVPNFDKKIFLKNASSQLFSFNALSQGY